MPLRNEDKTYIETQINEAVSRLRPKGWRKLVYWLREWGIVGVAITVIVALLGILISVSIYAFSGVKENAVFRTRTEDRLTSIDIELKGINGELAALRLEKNVGKPVSSKNIGEVKQFLSTARAGNTKISPAVIEDMGKQFVAASEKTPEAWSAALDFVNYKSFLNGFEVKVPPSQSGALLTRYEINAPPGQVPTFKSVGILPKDQGAVFAPIGKDTNPGETRSNQLLIAEGGAVILDGITLRM